MTFGMFFAVIGLLFAVLSLAAFFSLRDEDFY